jgi:hypothetical protein
MEHSEHLTHLTGYKHEAISSEACPYSFYFSVSFLWTRVSTCGSEQPSASRLFPFSRSSLGCPTERQMTITLRHSAVNGDMNVPLRGIIKLCFAELTTTECCRMIQVVGIGRDPMYLQIHPLTHISCRSR